MDKNYSIRAAQFSDFSAIIQIADAELGQGYLLADTIKEATCFCAKSRGEVVGFSLFYRQNLSVIQDIQSKSSSLTAYLNGVDKRRVALFKSLAVSKDYQRRGIGKALFHASLNYIQRFKPQVCVMTGWVSPDGLNIGKIAELNEFEAIEHVPDFWLDHSMSSKVQCPVCEKPPCKCTATILAKNFN